MTRFARDVRLIPIVLFATISLLALKVSGLVFDGGYTLAERMQARYRGDLQITSRESVPDQPEDRSDRKIRQARNVRVATALGPGNVQLQPR